MVGLNGSVTAQWGSTGLTRKRPDVSETRCHGITNKNHEPQCEGQTKPTAQGLGKCKGTPHWIGHGDKKASTRPARPFSCWALRCPWEHAPALPLLAWTWTWQEQMIQMVSSFMSCISEAANYSFTGWSKGLSWLLSCTFCFGLVRFYNYSQWKPTVLCLISVSTHEPPGVWWLESTWVTKILI